mgnify:CR=1 FL=1
MFRKSFLLFAAVFVSAIPVVAAEEDDTQPRYREETAKIEKIAPRQIAEQTELITAAPDNIRAYSRRGDAYFFSGQYDKAVADYEKMVEIDPAIDRQHWRLGLAYYYAGRYDKTAEQLGRYHTFDDQDRENGIWIFLANAKAQGVEKAREKMIRYTKDDRPPLPDVYRMFEGQLTTEELLAKIEAEIKTEQLPRQAAEQRRFYVNLYVGLFAEAAKQPKEAREAFLKATDSDWALKAGGGPAYMWHCARLRLVELDRPK